MTQSLVQQDNPGQKYRRAPSTHLPLSPALRQPLIAAGLLVPGAKRLRLQGVQPEDLQEPTPQGWVTERDDDPALTAKREDGGLGRGHKRHLRPWPTLRLDHATRSAASYRSRALW